MSQRTLIGRIAWDQTLGLEGSQVNAFFIDLFFLYNTAREYLLFWLRSKSILLSNEVGRGSHSRFFFFFGGVMKVTGKKRSVDQWGEKTKGIDAISSLQEASTSAL